jgi:DNA-binding HxlR family transcriptional regulator
MAEYLTQYQELANDIAAATFRVAELVGQSRLKEELQSAVFDFVLSGSNETILKLKTLIRFGQSIKEVKDINANILLKELGHLEDLAKEMNAAKLNVSIESEFKDDGQVPKWQSYDTRRPSGHVVANMANMASQGHGRQANVGQIFQFIESRQETRFKDIEQSFGSLSSRTLRRVVEQLKKSGRIERVGSPGPASFYRSTSGFSLASAPIEIPKIAIMKNPVVPEKPENRNSETIIAL